MGKRPRGLRLSPDGRTLYVSNGDAARLSVLDVGSSPWGIAVSRGTAATP